VLPAPVEIEPDLLDVELLERRERDVDGPVERLRLVVDADPEVARRLPRLCERTEDDRREDGRGDPEAPHPQIRTASRPSALSQRVRPSSRLISGCHPSTWRARVMSGRRTCGSSVGSASNTISLDEPVTLMTVCVRSHIVTCWCVR